MTTYNGPATVAADGAEHEVTAHLTIAFDGRLKEWYGTLRAPHDEAAWAIYQADTTTLRIGDREGVFHARGATLDMDIQGSGRPPFGD